MCYRVFTKVLYHSVLFHISKFPKNWTFKIRVLHNTHLPQELQAANIGYLECPIWQWTWCTEHLHQLGLIGWYVHIVEDDQVDEEWWFNIILIMLTRSDQNWATCFTRLQAVKYLFTNLVDQNIKIITLGTYSTHYVSGFNNCHHGELNLQPHTHACNSVLTHWATRPWIFTNTVGIYTTFWWTWLKFEVPFMEL